MIIRGYQEGGAVIWKQNKNMEELRLMQCGDSSCSVEMSSRELPAIVQGKPPGTGEDRETDF